jgi:RNA polymerase sigma factor (sigma-70 family)
MAEATRDGDDPRAELERRFVAALPDIERVIRFVARRHRLSRQEEEEFAGEVRLALVDNNYRILARFQGMSSLRTYLTTVIQRLFLDHRQKMWGKWRPSAEAQRRGPVACRLEILIHRDGLSGDQAVETLRMNYGATETREELLAIARDLPVRTARRHVADSEALEVAATDGSANPESVLEGRAMVERAQADLLDSFESLAAQDRLLLRLRFEDGFSVADIARASRADQGQLYRRLERLLRVLREQLEARGLVWPEILDMIEKGQCHLCLPRRDGEIETVRPSTQEGAQ